MKISTIIYTMTLCALTSAPTYAYVVYFDGVKLQEKPIHSESRTSDNRHASNWSWAQGLQDIKHALIEKKDALIEKLSASDSAKAQRSASAPQIHSTNSAALNAALTSAPLKHYSRSDFHNRSAENSTIAWEDIRVRQAGSLPSSQPQIKSNDDFWQREFRDAENASFDNSVLVDPFVADADAWTIGASKFSKIGLAENADATSSKRAIVPEPTSIGLMMLGLSALMLSRRKAHSVAARA